MLGRPPVRWEALLDEAWGGTWFAKAGHDPMLFIEHLRVFSSPGRPLVRPPSALPLMPIASSSCSYSSSFASPYFVIVMLIPLHLLLLLLLLCVSLFLFPFPSACFPCFDGVSVPRVVLVPGTLHAASPLFGACILCPRPHACGPPTRSSLSGTRSGEWLFASVFSGEWPRRRSIGHCMLSRRHLVDWSLPSSNKQPYSTFARCLCPSPSGAQGRRP